MYAKMKNIDSGLAVFLQWVFISISFQSWPPYLRFKGAAFLKDTFSQFFFYIRRVSSRLPHPV